MLTVSHQSRPHCLVLHGGIDGLIPVEGEDTFIVRCCSLLPSLEIKLICNTMLTFNSARAATVVPVFFLILKIAAVCAAQIDR